MYAPVSFIKQKIFVVYKIIVKPFIHLYIFFFVFLFPRVMWLGRGVYGVDAHLWDERSDRFVEAFLTGNFIETYQKYHPGVTLMWLSGFSKKLYRILFEQMAGYSPMIQKGVVYPEQFFVNLFVAKLPLVIVISLFLAMACFLLLKLKFPKTFVYLFALMLSFSPFFLGITKFLHLTGLETAAGFLSVVLAFYYTKTLKIHNLFFLGVVVAFGILTKISFLIFLPYIGLTLIIGNYLNYKNKYKKIFFSTFIQVAILVLFTLLFIFLLWPALWVVPIKVINLVFLSGVNDTGFGDVEPASILNNRFLYYYELLFIRSHGLTLISFLLSPIVLSKISNISHKYFSWLMFLFIPYFSFIMAIPSKQIDRYAVVMFPFFVFASASFIYAFSQKLSKSFRVLLYLTIFVYFAVLHFVYFPNYSSTFTELIGGAKGYSKYHKVLNRGEFYLELSSYLNIKDGKESYNKVLIVPTGQRDATTGGYLGTTFTSDGLVPKEKWPPTYYAPDYLDLDEVPKGRNCELIKTFGYRKPLQFSYLYLYECK